MRGSGAPWLSDNPYLLFQIPRSREQPRPVMRGCDSTSAPVARSGYARRGERISRFKNRFTGKRVLERSICETPPQNGSLCGKRRGDIQPYASRRRLFVNLSVDDTSTNRGLQENAILRHLDCRPLLLFGQFVLKSRGVYSQTPSRSRLFVDPSVRYDYLGRRYQSGPEAGGKGRVTAARKGARRLLRVVGDGVLAGIGICAGAPPPLRTESGGCRRLRTSCGGSSGPTPARDPPCHQPIKSVIPYPSEE